MILVLILAAVFMLAGMVAVSLSLLELDKRISALSQAMDGRYGKWLEQAAADMKKAVNEKEVRESVTKPPASPAPAPPRK